MDWQLGIVLALVAAAAAYLARRFWRSGKNPQGSCGCGSETGGCPLQDPGSCEESGQDSCCGPSESPGDREKS